MPRLLCAVCVSAALSTAPVAAQAQQGPTPPAPGAPSGAGQQRPQPIEFDFSAGWAGLAELAEQVRAPAAVPGVALAVDRGGQIVDAAVAGTTSLEIGRPLTLGDSFEWGSLTKSVTGTMIARLLADGVLTPDITIAEVFPELAM